MNTTLASLLPFGPIVADAKLLSRVQTRHQTVKVNETSSQKRRLRV